MTATEGNVIFPFRVAGGENTTTIPAPFREKARANVIAALGLELNLTKD
jgi:hypothetical protein